MKSVRAGIALLGAAMIWAAPASASTVTVSGGNTVRVTGSGSESNMVSVVYAAGTDTYLVTDATNNLDANGTCVAVDSRSATCPGAGIRTVAVNAGNGTDVIALDRLTIPAAIEGDLEGDNGTDLINGGRGMDDINGGSGSDLLDGHEGADDIDGGGDSDTVFYTDRVTPLNVTIGAVNGNDGNELDLTGIVRDTVHGDVEVISGGIGDDTMIGDASSETLIGGDGNDILVGNNGADQLLGFGGDDDLFGGNGDDFAQGALGADLLLGGPDEDRLAGGDGDDVIRGKKGFDVMTGKTGIDRINAKDGARDGKINCGPGGRSESAKRDKKHDPKPKSC